MSCSFCLKCGQMVGGYDKYCPKCQKEFNLPDLPDFQKTNFPNRKYEDWAKEEVQKDLKKTL